MITGQEHLLGLNPTWLAFVQWVLQRADEAGLEPIITSGYRSSSSQAQLYANYRAGRSRLPAAPAGYSAHEYGLAVDVWAGNGGQAQLIALFKRYGAETVSGDPPHFQYPGFAAAIHR